MSTKTKAALPKAIKLGDTVKITASGEAGKVIGAAQYLHSDDSFLVRYKANDGRAVEAWWGIDALEVI